MNGYYADALGGSEISELSNSPAYFQGREAKLEVTSRLITALEIGRKLLKS